MRMRGVDCFQPSWTTEASFLCDLFEATSGSDFRVIFNFVLKIVAINLINAVYKLNIV